MTAFQASVYILALFLLGVIINLIAKYSDVHRDSGIYWSRVLLWHTGTCLLLFIASSLLWFFPSSLWIEYHHFLGDLSGSTHYASILIAVGLLWLFFQLIFLLPSMRHAHQEKSQRWLAGILQDDGSRLWVLLYTAPLLFLLFNTFDTVALGQYDYPAATWALAATMSISLLFVAFSSSLFFFAIPIILEEKPGEHNKEAWPKLMRQAGIEIGERVHHWAADNKGDEKPKLGAIEFQNRLAEMGMHHIPVQLINAITPLLGRISNDQPFDLSRCVMAAEHCGQIEVSVVAATMLRQRFHTITLLIVPEFTTDVANAIQRCGGTDETLSVVQCNTEPSDAASIWLCDATTLSKYLIPWLKTPSNTRRVGMVIWWQLHEYSGVMAANLWGIAHRLHRLLNGLGRSDIRTIVFMNYVSSGGGQFERYVYRLLPHPFADEKERVNDQKFVYIKPVFSGDLYLHYPLTVSEPTRKKSKSTEDMLHPALMTAKASLEGGWQTTIDQNLLREKISTNILGAVEVFIDGEKEGLDASLQSTSPLAEVLLLHFSVKNILYLEEVLCQLGREQSTACYVASPVADNPYVAYLLQSLKGASYWPVTFSRRLVGSAANESIIMYHLQQAIYELPGTDSSLAKEFQYKKDTIKKTLSIMLREKRIEYKEVRSLDKQGKILPEFEYHGKTNAPKPSLSLRCVGNQLIEVRDPSGGQQNDGVRLMVDIERITIEAYPGRCFLHKGTRYRIEKWCDPKVIKNKGEILCKVESKAIMTWRCAGFSIEDIRAFSGKTLSTFGYKRRLSCISVNVNYEETVRGWLEVNVSKEKQSVLGKAALQRIGRITQSFNTSALAILIDIESDYLQRNQLYALCQALRYVFPVHVGIEENAVEFVPIIRQPIMIDDESEYSGFVIVDLYPDGIGLVQTIAEDHDLINQLLQAALNWLNNCEHHTDEDYCESCFKRPGALALSSRYAHADGYPKKSDAIAILSQLVATDSHV